MAEDRRLHIVPGQLSLGMLYRFWRCERPAVTLAEDCWPKVDAAADCIARIVAEETRTYGVNTGFGILARQTIAREDVHELQRRLVCSHMAGVGDHLSKYSVRLCLLLKIGSLALGHSGVRRAVIERLLALLNADALPVIPAQGSVGASGDLAPLAALSGALIGEGEIDLEGERLPAGEALRRLELVPLELEAKEGLALLNGTQVSTALALEGYFRATELFTTALASGAMSVDAALGSDTPFDPRIQELRGQPGQSETAAVLRALLAGSEIRASHADCDRVQDPYSLRCQPQVMGAALDLIRAAGQTLLREANAVSDNPLVFPDTGEVLSGGNFHAEPVALAADQIAVALAEVAALSERRIALLTDAHHSQLPAFLIEEPGLNSGFMIVHVTAAALASEMKWLAHPVGTDSLPTSANQEDHVSMATHAARRLGPVTDCLRRLLAIELLAAAQGIDHRAPLTTSEPLDRLLQDIRAQVPPVEEDRPFTPDIEAIATLVAAGWPAGELFKSVAGALKPS